MSAKTKIVVLHMKEVIYTAVFLLLALLLGVVIFLMFHGKPSDMETASEDVRMYQPGIYRSTIAINDNTFDVEVTVDSSRIKSIGLVNLSESTTAMFPLMEPALDSLASQIYTSQSLESVSYPEDNKYTSMLLLEAISTALKKAEKLE